MPRWSPAFHKPTKMVTVRGEGAAVDTFTRIDPRSLKKLLLFLRIDIPRNDRVNKSVR